jgi:nitrogen regulatory protein PII
MYHMVLLIVDNVDQCFSVLDAWEALEVGGITILESTGLGRVRKQGLRDDLPLMPSLANLLKGREERHRTLFTVVDSEAKVDQLVAATQKIIGDLNNAHNGVLFVLPVSRVVGLQGGQARARGGGGN